MNVAEVAQGGTLPGRAARRDEVGDAEPGISEAPTSVAINTLRNMREPEMGASPDDHGQYFAG